MSQVPWMKFYPADWRADPALRLCSIGARGLWIEMLCLMHESQPRGSLVNNGKPITARQLAALAGCSPSDAMAHLQEIEDAGVFSRDDDGTIFSRRIRRDDERAAQDKMNGKGGGNPILKKGVNPPHNPPHNPTHNRGYNGGDNPSINRTHNGGDKAQKLEARVVSIQGEIINVDTTLVGYRDLSRNTRGGCA